MQHRYEISNPARPPLECERKQVGEIRVNGLVHLLIAGTLLLNACATPPSVGPKVQTFHELLIKLKKGFDEGTLDTPEFYARELGYRLEAPDSLTAIQPPHAPIQEIRFDDGELKGEIVYVGPIVMPDGRRFLAIRTATKVSLGEKCFTLQELQSIWGPGTSRIEDVIPPHGPSPIALVEYRSLSRGIERAALAQIWKSDNCLSRLSVGQYSKESAK